MLAPLVGRAYAPSPEETLFYSEEEAIRYARGALFDVDGNIASRSDLPDGSSFILKPVGDKFGWVKR